MTIPDQDESNKKLTVCYFGTYRQNYVRNEVMIAGLRTQGVDVFECHVPLWTGVEDRVAVASGGWLSVPFARRLLSTYSRLIRQFFRLPRYDVLIVGYPGQFDVYLAKILHWLTGRRQPIVLDILMSLHLIATERGLVARHPVSGRLIYFLEKWGLKAADYLITDTSEYLDYYVAKYQLDATKFFFVPLGVDDRLYFPRERSSQPAPEPEKFEVIYYGTFIPLHGVDTILQAAARLQDRDPTIHFSFYGEGQEKEKAVALAANLGLQNVDFLGWIDKNLLPEKIAAADVCLGVFGNTKQSRCTIQNKIWEGLMMQRPVITGDSPTVRESLLHGQELYLVERQNPVSLADGLQTLKENPELRCTLVKNGFARVQHNTIAATGRRLAAELSSLK